MIDIEIQPLVGVGPVLLGATRAQVHAVLGHPEASQDNREVFLGGLFVDYDLSGTVEFIELARSAHYRGLFHGICLHEVTADQALTAVSRFGTYDSTDPELGYSYVFLDLQLSLWRGVRPSPDQAATDRAGRHFEAVGIGIHGYFQPASTRGVR